MPKDVDELKQFMSEEWEKIPVPNIILSMKQRCELILQHNGNRITYWKIFINKAALNLSNESKFI